MPTRCPSRFGSPRLVAGIVNAGREVVTGYRWMVPADDRLSSAVVAAANASIATLLRVPYVANACWGGTMVMSRAMLDRIDIRRYWEGAILDDLQMTRALRDHKVMIFSPRQSLLLSPVSMELAAGLRIRPPAISARPHARSGLVASGRPGNGGSGILLRDCGRPALAGKLVRALRARVSAALGEVRTRYRQRIVRAIWGKEQSAASPDFGASTAGCGRSGGASTLVCVFSRDRLAPDQLGRC